MLLFQCRGSTTWKLKYRCITLLSRWRFYGRDEGCLTKSSQMLGDIVLFTLFELGSKRCWTTIWEINLKIEWWWFDLTCPPARTNLGATGGAAILTPGETSTLEASECLTKNLLLASLLGVWLDGPQLIEQLLVFIESYILNVVLWGLRRPYDRVCHWCMTTDLNVWNICLSWMLRDR